ncbi:glycoside hydrolase family 93 protein [Durotheca rogersii]|uniref:glycoside hydrolase family 93 protein n=1 Tax=Durotheca rogersii TaxID=419775 RepID=UPI00221F9F76|nr:glycoside hydrolase family 93 protein [Durotheca rogersii]KAI5865308.1 glycoside hydrolase family 93 protein [Durotheca rogersii]
MSLLRTLITCLNIACLVSASPIGDVRHGLGWRAASNLQHAPVTRRDDTVRFPDIDASFVVGSSESRLADGGTYPRLARLDDGGILAISTLWVSETERALKISRSNDEGRTFSPIGEVARGTGNVDNGFLIQLPSGTVLAAFRNHDVSDDGILTYFRITVCHSQDGGRSWTFLSQAAEQPARGAGYNGLWEPFVRIARDGSIQLTYSGELSQSNQETFRVVSRDEGRTWTAPTNLRLHAEDRNFRDGMQGIVSVRDVESDEDVLVMVFEVRERDFFYLATVTSHDDGNTWGSREVIYRPNGRNAGAPQIASVGNHLAVVFMTDEDTAAGDIAWPNRADIKMIFSTELRDGTLTWSTDSALLSDSSSYWPGIFQLGTDDVIAVYERANVPLGRRISSA